MASKRSTDNDSSAPQGEGEFDQNSSIDEAVAKSVSHTDPEIEQLREQVQKQQLNTDSEIEELRERVQQINTYAGIEQLREQVQQISTDSEIEQLREQVQKQQDQINTLFYNLKRRGDGSNGGKQEDLPIVRLFKKRMLVLKQAYPNTRV